MTAGLRRHLVNAAAAAAGGVGCLLLLAPAPAAPGGILCITCVDMLLFCCPKPCPTVDPLQVARRALETLVLNREEEQLHRQRLERERLQQALGAATATADGSYSGRRTVATLDRPSAFPDRTPAHRAAHAAAAVSGPGTASPDQRLRRLRETAVAAADLAVAALQDDLAVADAHVDQAANAVHNARDLRDHLRLVAELEYAVARYHAIAAAARAEQLRLRQSLLIRSPATLPAVAGGDPGRPAPASTP